MNVTVEEISSIKKKINIEIPLEQVTKEVESFYQQVGKQAKIKGFRPGKIPRDILERHFKDYVKSEVIQKLIQETYPAALSEKDLHPVSPPVIDPGELESGKPFQYSATVEVKPEIKIEGYIGLNIEGNKESAKEEEVEERLKGLQNLHAQLRTVPEPRPIQSGDHVIIDYEARMDNKPLEEGKAVDFTVEVGSGRFIPALEEKLVGLNLEEEKEIEVPFPEDYGYKKWAGKTVSFLVKVKEIKEKVLPPLDDEFAKDLGDYASLEDLKAKLKEEIEKEKELMLDRQLKDQMIEQLIQANSFEIPESMVVEQAKALVSDTKLRLASQGIALKNLNIPEEKLQEDYREVAQKQVRTYLILEKIAAQEGMTVTDEEADERLQSISEKTHQKIDVVKRYYEKNGLIPELKTGILTDKTLNFLLEKANIS
ncbi:MAG: trigger factor [Thermodesulfobacteriota bacterium]|nr:trigger factor [Thermodesulfobacteriota bacterium]